MSDDNIIHYYRQRAPEYEKIYYRDKPERRAELEAEAERLKALVADKSVLDTPCGTGYWLERMAQTASHIVASDIAVEMLQEAHRKKYEGPVEFVRANLYGLPFRDDVFDVLALGFWFSHHPRQDYDRLFDAVLAPLKPGGRLWMIDNNPPAEGSKLRSAGYDDQGNHLAVRYLENGTEFAILKNYFAQEELVSLFSERYTIERLTYGKCYWSVELRPR